MTTKKLQKFSLTEYNNLIKFVALTDTMHDYCGLSNEQIYNYDTVIFTHIILALLKPSFDSIKEEFSKFYNIFYTDTKNYNDTKIWYTSMTKLEDNIDEFIIDILHNKGIFDKNYKSWKKYIPLVNISGEITSNLFKINLGNLKKMFHEDYDNYKSKSIKLYNYLRENKDLTFVLDANDVYKKDKFFCIYSEDLGLDRNHFTLYKGLFSKYDAGSSDKIGGASEKKNTSNSESGSDSGSDVDFAAAQAQPNAKEKVTTGLLAKCDIEDKCSYSLRKEDHELIFVEEIGVDRNKDNDDKFELYIKIDSQTKYVDFGAVGKYKQKHTLSLPSFAKLLSLIESTINRPINQSESSKKRVQEYFHESLIKNAALQSIFDIYQIKLLSGTNEFYDIPLKKHRDVIDISKEEDLKNSIKIAKSEVNKYCPLIDNKYKEEFIKNINIINYFTKKNNAEDKDVLYKKLINGIKNEFKVISNKNEELNEEFASGSNKIDIFKSEFISEYRGNRFDAFLKSTIDAVYKCEFYSIELKKKEDDLSNHRLEEEEKIICKLKSEKEDKFREEIDNIENILKITLKNTFISSNPGQDLIYDKLIDKIKDIIDIKQYVQLKKIDKLSYITSIYLEYVEPIIKENNISLTTDVSNKIIIKICEIKEKEHDRLIHVKFIEIINNLLKKKKNSNGYIPLEPLKFNLALLDFKRAMDYLQVKACVESNINNTDVSHVFVSQDRSAILFGLLKDCRCIKTAKEPTIEEIKGNKKEKDTILTLYNFGENNRKKIIVDENYIKKVTYNDSNIHVDLTNDEKEDEDEDEDDDEDDEDNEDNEEYEDENVEGVLSSLKNLDFKNTSGGFSGTDNKNKKIQNIINEIKTFKPTHNIPNVETKIIQILRDSELEYIKNELKEEIEKEMDKLKSETNLLNILFTNLTTSTQSGGRASTFSYMTPSIQSSIIKNTHNKFTKRVNSYNNLSKFKTLYKNNIKKTIDIPKTTINTISTSTKRTVNTPITSTKRTVNTPITSTKRTVNTPTTINILTTDVNTYKTTNNNTKTTTRTLYNSKTSKSNKTTNKTLTYSEIDTETYDDNEANLDKTVKIDVLIHMFSEEKLFVKFLEIYKKVYTSEISIFWYITYHTLFFIIDKVYNTKEIDSFIELDKMINQNT